MSSKPITLFVFEGKRQEKKYLNTFLKALSVDINRIEVAFCTHIYALHNKLTKSDGLDTFELLKEGCDTLDSQDYDRDDIARIYLFFDYDGHAPGAKDQIVQEMLETFDNETEQGKLYISYPMLEALRDTKNLVFKIKDGKQYKQDIGNTGIQNIAVLNEQEFKDLTLNHLKKANDLVNNSLEASEQLIEQSDIFSAQLTKHIPKKEVAVLSALPLFYLDYKGVSVLKLL
ncbi:MAG: hypothetical protein HFP81_04775 [Methylococcales symbiont of Hymedesmia sp. n. MRB-2018]|nr:MAG: hypothetical protein HFP81_04775 [Methylococcales symbiont of Hymedesmia sp. n. MRB-2018]